MNTEEQELWYKVVMLRLEKGDDTKRALLAADLILDGFRKTFQTQPPAQKE